MSWFGSSNPTAELENKINEATSESIPNGEIDLPVGLEITDIIRSKQVPPKQCMRSLKKRLTLIYQNPNLLTSTLKLVDLCVKNAGYNFLVEISSKEFIDYLVDFIFEIHYDTNDRTTNLNAATDAAGKLILSLIQDWKLSFEGQMQLNYVEKKYTELVRKGYTFPASNNSNILNAKFIDSETPPDWVDNDECMICYTPFSMITRKHHCRSCGGVFCQNHSSKSIPLYHLGIMESVRVCDNCYDKLTKKGSKKKSVVPDEDEDQDLKRALELSMQDAGVRTDKVERVERVDRDVPDEDEEMKAAIAASLKEFEAEERIAKQRYDQEAQQQSRLDDFYGNIALPDSNSTYQPRNDRNRADDVKPKFQDLTSADEERVNLYISLMSQVQNDPSKRDNILYDPKLSMLHSEIIKLKPKLNRSVRNAIERYEAFMSLNNKISTVTKLYDQFLESRLNLAFGAQTLYNGPGYEGYLNEYGSPSQAYNQPQQSHQQSHQRLPQSPQSPYQSQIPQYSQPSIPYSQPDVPLHYLQQPHYLQYPPEYQSESQPESSQIPQYTSPTLSKQNTVPDSPYSRYPSQPNFEEPIPQNQMNRMPNQIASQVSGLSSNRISQPIQPNGSGQVSPQNTYYATSPSQPEYQDSGEASTKFPTIEDLEEKYSRDLRRVQKSNVPERQPELSSVAEARLPDLPDLPVPEPKRAEPEPLIEL